MGDAFSDHGCDSPVCPKHGGKFDPYFGCFECRPPPTAKKTRETINLRIKTLRRFKKEANQEWLKNTAAYNKEIRELQANRRRVTNDNPTGMVKIDVKELEKYVDEWEPGHSLWNPKRKEKK